MGLYAITFTETRDATLVVEAPTVEHARDTAWTLIDDRHFNGAEGYNRWISDKERLDDYGTD